MRSVVVKYDTHVFRHFGLDQPYYSPGVEYPRKSHVKSTRNTQRQQDTSRHIFKFSLIAHIDI